MSEYTLLTIFFSVATLLRAFALRFAGEDDKVANRRSELEADVFLYATENTDSVLLSMLSTGQTTNECRNDSTTKARTKDGEWMSN